MISRNVILILSLLSTSLTFGKTFKGATLDYPPYQYRENNMIKGLAVDIIKESLQRLGHGIDITFLPWKRAVLSVKKGKYDILFNAGKNDRRQKWAYYVEHPLIWQKYVFLAKKDSKIQLNKNFSNANNLRLGVRNGYLYGQGRLRKAMDQKHFREIIGVDSSRQSILLLNRNRVDLIVADYSVIAFELNRMGLADKVKVINDQETKAPLIALSWPTYMVLSKKTIPRNLKYQLEETLKKMEEDGTIKSIISKYKDNTK